MIKILVVGQTPPPFGGQAVMIDRLLHSNLPGIELFHVRMAFSRTMAEMGTMRWSKLFHLLGVIVRIVYHRLVHGVRVLYYPPAGPQRVPMVRDLAILLATRWMFDKTIFHFHAGGVSELYPRLPRIGQFLFCKAYFHADAAIRLAASAPEDGRLLRARSEYIIPNGIDDLGAGAGGREQGNKGRRGEEEKGEIRRCAVHVTAALDPPVSSSPLLPFSPSSPFRLLFVGLLSESKGLLVFLEAVARLLERDVPVEAEIVGQFSSAAVAARARKAVVDLRLAAHVTFRGVLSGRDKRDAYARADVLCFPTFFESETFGLVLLEAMSFGLPVVATRWRGIPSIVDDGETGLLVGVRDPDAVAEAMLRLAQDPALRGRMGVAARSKFLREYTIDRHLARMGAMFTEVAGRESEVGSQNSESRRHKSGVGNDSRVAGTAATHSVAPSPRDSLTPVPRLLITGGSGFIGTNLVESLRRDGIACLNLDVAPPLCPEHTEVWRACDVLDRESLGNAFAAFAPTHVVHLAARTDCNETATLDDYRQNTAGTQNVLDAIAATPSVERVIITSTQFVCRPGHPAAHDQDYDPHTVYGQSKVVAEQLTRRANLRSTWTIVRPTTIWGPWLLRHRDQLFRVLRKGLYIHPGRKPCIRSWGYVGNVVHQIRAILTAPADRVGGKTIYLGDRPLNLLDWVNAASMRLTGKRVRVVPRWCVFLVAAAGEVVSRLGIGFPITLSRYHSMTEDYVTPMDATFNLLGETPYSMEAGIEETIKWLAGEGEKENGRRGEGEKRRKGESIVRATASPRVPVSPSPLLPFSPSSPVRWPRKVDVFGVGVSVTDYEETSAAVVEAARLGVPAIVTCHPGYGIIAANRDTALRASVNRFQVVTPDGQPVRWAMNMLGRAGLRKRVYGPELMLRICRRAAAAGVPIYLYGSTQPVVEALRESLCRRFPTLRVAGAEAPPFRPLRPDEDREMVERINASGAGILFLGLSCPKQDYFAAEHRGTIRPVQICVGAAFDFHAGTKPMAPSWMQRAGLEWVFRLAQEPRRLWRRYLVANSLFMAKFLAAFVRRVTSSCQLPVVSCQPHVSALNSQSYSHRLTTDNRQPTTVPVDVVVPCFNERPAAEDLIANLGSLSAALGDRYRFRFLLVDDGSTDGTADRLRGLVNGSGAYRILQHERNRGIAAAIMTGIANARAEIVCSMDADCSYDPRQLGDMIPMLSEGVDLVTASPYHPLGGVGGVPAWRLTLSRSASSLYREVLRHALHTYTSCFRVYRRRAMAGIALADDGFAGIAEMLWRLERRGSRIVEYPAVLRSRRLGQSKMRIAGAVLAHLRLLARVLREQGSGFKVQGLRIRGDGAIQVHPSVKPRPVAAVRGDAHD